MRIRSITLCYITIQIVTHRVCVCFASIHASTAAKSYILNFMWTAANFIVEGRMRPQVVHHWCTPMLLNSIEKNMTCAA